LRALGGQPFALGCGDAVAGQVGFGDDDEVGAGHHHAVVQRALSTPTTPGLGVAPGRASRRRIGFGQLLDHAVRGAGARRDDGRRSAGGDVRAQHREDLVDAGLLAPRRRRRADVQLDRRFVTQLAQRPPRVAAIARPRDDIVEMQIPRCAERFDVDGCVTADRGRRP
jgi:hypothetical protein